VISETPQFFDIMMKGIKKSKGKKERLSEYQDTGASGNPNIRKNCSISDLMP
jgi:hypothetical protein